MGLDQIKSAAVLVPLAALMPIVLVIIAVLIAVVISLARTCNDASRR